jgi:hypothetical protein
MARLRTGYNRPAKIPFDFQVAIMDTVALHSLYCVEPQRHKVFNREPHEPREINPSPIGFQNLAFIFPRRA